MAQMTLRTSEELMHRVRVQAKHEGRSVNDWVSTILEAATNPDTSSDDIRRIRERLQFAGLLQEHRPREVARPAADQVAQARAAFGQGAQLSGYISDGRE